MPSARTSTRICAAAAIGALDTTTLRAVLGAGTSGITGVTGLISGGVTSPVRLPLSLEAMPVISPAPQPAASTAHASTATLRSNDRTKAIGAGVYLASGPRDGACAAD